MARGGRSRPIRAGKTATGGHPLFVGDMLVSCKSAYSAGSLYESRWHREFETQTRP